MAAQWLLRRRRIPSRLTFGVRRGGPPGRALEFHAWLTVAGKPVVGGAGAETFTPLPPPGPGAPPWPEPTAFGASNRRDPISDRRVTGCPAPSHERRGGTPPLEGLFAALRLALATADRVADAAALASIADWPALARLARRHRVGPLVSRAVRAIDGPAAAEAALAPLRERAIRHGLGQLSDLRQATDSLDAAGVPSLVLKGLPLGARLYGTPLARHGYDIDLLVEPDAVHDAERALTQGGWRLLKPSFRPTPARLRCYDRFAKDRLFAGPNGPLELHHRLVNNPALLPLEFDRLRQCAVQTEVGGHRFAALADGDLLVYLAVHGQLHGWSRLKWLCDFAALLATTPADRFAAALEQCRTLGLRLEPLFGPALLLCRECLHVEPPADGLPPVGRQARRAARAARGFWTQRRGGAGLRGAARRIDELRAALAIRPSPRTLWHEFARLCVAPYDLGRIDLPDRLFWLYFPLRPVLYLAGRLRPPVVSPEVPGAVRNPETARPS